MKNLSRIFFVMVFAALLMGNVFAQEMMEQTGEEEDVQSPMMAPGMQGMMGMPMMQGTMGGQGMQGGSGMMGGGMMCPMCGKMMQNMMPMMQQMMGCGMMGSGTQGMMGGSGMMGSGMQGMMGGSGMMGMGQMPMMGSGMMGGMDMMGMMKPHIAALADKLDLSEEQQDKLKALHISYKKDMIRRNADREIAQIDLDELIQQEETDLNAVEMQIRKIADLEAATKYSWVKLWTDAKSLLTEEQRAAFKKLMMEQKAPMMGQMMGGSKPKTDNPGPKSESGGYLEHHK